MITTEQVKELRDATGVSVMQCRKALEEAGGDMQKALMILKKKSSEIAAKKSDREAKDGVVVIKKEGTKAVAVILNCETDFVAKNEDFTSLANTIAEKALADGVEATQTAAPEMISAIVQKVGENIQLGDIREFTGETLGLYVHNGKSGVVTNLTGGTTDLAKDIAMHIAAMKPAYMSANDVPEDAKRMATELFAKEVAESEKPEDIQKKILEGKISSYFKEQTLLDQPFIKNPDVTVGKLLESSGATLTEYAVFSI
ncbi:MAG: translation elongation factor Ts [Candidatus Pacebacteria bacterium]|jgi:elongation factor Ts|nr:translation elongation factor Ts [Candidatus Paceibacterota bacterium]